MPITTTDVHRRFKGFVAAFESRREAAAALGISESYLRDLWLRRRPITDRFLKKIGLQRVVTVTFQERPSRNGGTTAPPPGA